MDLSVLTLAVPSLTADLHPSATELLWIVDVYGFLVAGFLITMGVLGDRIGRRRLLLIDAGLAMALAGAALLTRAGASGGPELVVGAAAVLSLGLAPLFTLAADVAVGAAPPEREGAAAGISETSSSSAARSASPCSAPSRRPSIAAP